MLDRMPANERLRFLAVSGIFLRIRGSDDLRLDDDQLAVTNEGARESRHR